MPATLTVPSLLDSFIHSLRAERALSENTIAAYRTDLNGFLAHIKLRSKDETTADRDDVLSYFSLLRRKGMAPATLLRKSSAIKMYSRFLIQERSTKIDLASGWEIGGGKQKRVPGVLTIDEVQRLIHAPDTSVRGIRDRAMLEALYACGLRVSELCELTIGQVDLQSHLLRPFGKGVEGAFGAASPVNVACSAELCGRSATGVVAGQA